MNKTPVVILVSAMSSMFMANHATGLQFQRARESSTTGEQITKAALSRTMETEAGALLAGSLQATGAIAGSRAGTKLVGMTPSSILIK